TARSGAGAREDAFVPVQLPPDRLLRSGSAGDLGEVLSVRADANRCVRAGTASSKPPAAIGRRGFPEASLSSGHGGSLDSAWLPAKNFMNQASFSRRGFLASGTAAVGAAILSTRGAAAAEAGKPPIVTPPAGKRILLSCKL